MSDILVGGTERVILTFTDINGVLVDPATITVIVTEPDLTEATYTLVGGGVINDESQTGLFYADHPITQVGIHVAKGVATGPAAAALVQFVSVG